MQNRSEQAIEEWKFELIVAIARRKGFRCETLEDACQQLLLVVLKFKYDAQHSSRAAERTALISLIENQLNMMLRSEGRRKNHEKKIQRVCGPSSFEPFRSDEHIQHERQYELGMDVRDAVSRLSTQEQAVCRALSQGTPRCKIAADLKVSRYEVERIIEQIAEQFSDWAIDAWVRG